MILRVAWCGARAVWRPGLRARGIAVVVPGIDGGALPLVSREGGCCYGGRAARAARVWRRRFLVLGGSPAAARRALSACHRRGNQPRRSRHLSVSSSRERFRAILSVQYSRLVNDGT